MQSMYIEVREALTNQELTAAQQLRQQQYSAAGYIPETTRTVPAAATLGVEESTFIACTEGSVVGTITTAVCSPEQPSLLASAFPEPMIEISNDARCHVIGAMAISSVYRTAPRVVLALIEMVMRDVVYRQLPTAMCTVHPKHQYFYINRLGFTPVAACDNLPGLVNAPAVLLQAKTTEMLRQYAVLSRRTQRRVVAAPVGLVHCG